MITLHETLERTLDAAERQMRMANFFKKSKSQLELNQFIAGPPGSGKTTQAFEYIAQMHDVGLITNEVPSYFYCSNGRVEDLAKTISSMPDGGAMIFDDFSTQFLNAPQYKHVLGFIVQATAKGVVIVLGDKAPLERASMDDPGVQRRFPSIVQLTKAYTPDEQTAFHAAKSSSERVPRPNLSVRIEKARVERLILAWKNATADDFILKKAAKPLKTVRFTTPKAPR